MGPLADKPCVLAIETSCDETAAAVLRGERDVLSDVVASQAELHEQYGGIVPELACRAHAEAIVPVVDRALRDAGATLADLLERKTIDDDLKTKLIAALEEFRGVFQE